MGSLHRFWVALSSVLQCESHYRGSISGQESPRSFLGSFCRARIMAIPVSSRTTSFFEDPKRYINIGRGATPHRPRFLSSSSIMGMFMPAIPVPWVWIRHTRQLERSVLWGWGRRERPLHPFSRGSEWQQQGSAELGTILGLFSSLQTTACVQQWWEVSKSRDGTKVLLKCVLRELKTSNRMVSQQFERVHLRDGAQVIYTLLTLSTSEVAIRKLRNPLKSR